MQNATDPLSRLEIHLDQICWNYLSLQKQLKKGTDCAAVVKADAYGLGATEIVPELHKANCRHFYVAHAGEGIAVRKALQDNEAHIYALNGIHGSTPAEMSHNGLVPVLNTPADIAAWAAYAQKTDKKQPAVIHIDTGMNRLGLSETDVSQLQPDVLKPLDIRYVMSHLACADEPDHPKNKEQLENFKRLTARLGLPCRLSFANSSGIFLGTDYHFDQVRPGCTLYGINPQPVFSNPMHGVVTLKARILQIRSADKNETVGYNATYQLLRPTKLAIISAGYADGLLRSLTGHGMVYIQGQKCPMVGRVSMDAVIVDVTDVTPLPQAGDWAEIIGPHQTADDVAAQAKTIGYEILTSLGGRYARFYSGQG